LIYIGKYTQQTWGKNQRDLYIDKLFAAFEQLCKSPNLGKLFDYIKFGMRSLPVEKHIIYYFVKKNDLFVSVILHENLQPTLHLH